MNWPEHLRIHHRLTNATQFTFGTHDSIEVKVVYNPHNSADALNAWRIGPRIGGFVSDERLQEWTDQFPSIILLEAT